MSDTSSEAFDRFKAVLSERRFQTLVGLRAIGGIGTAREIASACTDNAALGESIRRRASDLVRLGFAVEHGKKMCSVTGYVVKAYRLKDPSIDQ
jgi:hypothetical protein